MKTAYHTLIIVNGSCDEIHQEICKWIENSKFQLVIKANTTRILATYPGWYGFGITDKQTMSEMEILLSDSDGKTAISIYHHTQSFLIFCGAMVGDILEREVDSLIMSIKGSFSIA